MVTHLGVSAIGPGDKQLLFSLGAWVITAPRKKRWGRQLAVINIFPRGCGLETNKAECICTQTRRETKSKSSSIQHHHHHHHHQQQQQHHRYHHHLFLTLSPATHNQTHFFTSFFHIIKPLFQILMLMSRTVASATTWPHFCQSFGTNGNVPAHLKDLLLQLRPAE